MRSQPHSSIVTDKIYVCPTCGGAAVTASSLVGGQGKCRSCGWEGPVEELLVVPIQHTMGSADEIKHAFHSELHALFGKAFSPLLLQYLIRWGFLAAKAPSRESTAYLIYVQIVGRYIDAAARGAGNAILETREEIEIERRGGGKEVPRA